MKATRILAPAIAFGLAAPATAAAEPRTFVVTLVTGSSVTVTVDVPAGTPVDRIRFPTLPLGVLSVQEVAPRPAPGVEVQVLPPPPAAPAPPAPTPATEPSVTPRGQTPESRRKAKSKRRKARHAPAVRPRGQTPWSKRGVRRAARRVVPEAPVAGDPGFALALPGAAPIGVPDFFIEKFRIPPFLLPIYQAAGIEYGIRWEVLAAINEIETDYGRNLNVSSAGAVGWMQFMPATWRIYGTDGNRDGSKDPYNPVDAIFAAARYLRAAGADRDLRRAIFAYNHADWYVDSVLLRARLIGGIPADLVGSLTGLAQGRFPVAARATYARARGRRVEIFARRGAAAVAVQDGKVVALGRRTIRLRDVFGNTYTYGALAGVARERDVAGQKERIFANPWRANARKLLDRRRRPLRVGSRVVAGTVLGRLGAGPLRFGIRPAGRGAPSIDPKPILDGWKLLESTAIYRRAGRNALTERGPSIGQILLLGKAQLQRRVLANPRIELYECGRRDVRAGIVDRRVLAALEFLAASGLKPSVSSLRCGHGFYTKSGNVSHHSSGNAVDIAKVNGIPVLGNQGAGSVTDAAIRRLLTLQGFMKPAQIISLMTYEGAGNTMALPDHADHIHVGWQPDAGRSRGADALLRPSQWSELAERLGRIPNPVLERRP